MPRLPDEVADRTDEQQAGGFTPLPEGTYICVLNQVEEKQGQAGPFWSWEFEVAPGEQFTGRKLWVNTSLSDKALWKLKEVFSAFGYDAHTDTDELVGEWVLLSVSQRMIESGSRAGQVGNNVDQVLPYADPKLAGSSDEEPF